MEMNDLELGYLAGLIDGEGCIRIQKTIYKSISSLYPSIAIQMTDLKAIEFVSEITSIDYHGPYQYGKNKSYWAWYAIGKKAIDLLDVITPHLKIKQKQALLMSCFPLGQRGFKKSPEIKDLQEQIYNEIKQLNK